jgi:hypothetical protein
MKTSFKQTKRCSLLTMRCTHRLTLTLQYASSSYSYGYLHWHADSVGCHRCLCVHPSRLFGVSILMQYIPVILYLERKEANFSAGVGFTLGRVCSLTTLVNLNSRVRGRQDGGSSNSPHTAQWQIERASATYDLEVVVGRGEGITVHQTSIVHVDDSNKIDFKRKNSDVSACALLCKANDGNADCCGSLTSVRRRSRNYNDCGGIYILRFDLTRHKLILSNISSTVSRLNLHDRWGMSPHCHITASISQLAMR